LGGSEGDGVAELFKLADQPAGLTLGVAATLEEVLATVVGWLAGGEHGPDHHDQAVGDRMAALFGPRRRAIWR